LCRWASPEVSKQPDLLLASLSAYWLEEQAHEPLGNCKFQFNPVMKREETKSWEWSEEEEVGYMAAEELRLLNNPRHFPPQRFMFRIMIMVHR